MKIIFAIVLVSTALLVGGCYNGQNTNEDFEFDNPFITWDTNSVNSVTNTP